MHRLTPFALLALLVPLIVGPGCTTAKKEVRDPPYVEQLRVRITKVRHALMETRRTISLSQGAPYLPELYVRLAELTSEEAKYHYRVAYEREQRSTKALHVPQVRLLKEQAISTYRMVLRRFPKTPLAPRILFNIGHEYRELGEYEEMQKALDELGDKHPTHPLAGEARLVMGDYYFDKNELPKASEYYAKILAGEAGKVTGLALYKLAWVHVNEGDCKKALDAFERAIAAARTYSEKTQSSGKVSDQDIDVRREALVDLTYCYSRERKPDQAVDYVRKLAFNRDAYIAALEKLAARYSIMNQSVGAMEVGRELLSLAPDTEDRLDDGRMLYGALKRSRRFHEIGDDIRLLTRVAIRGAHRPGRSAESRDRLLEEFEAYARDLATRAQKRALRKRSTRAFKNQVARAYTAYLDAFPHTEHRPEMLLNLADMQAELGRPLTAGRRYIEAATGIQEPAEQADALYDAVVQLQTSLEKASEQTHVQRVVARSGLRRAGTELLGHETTPDRARKVKFAIAKTLYDEGRHREAIDLLNAVAYEYPGTVEARASVHMVLDSFNTINDFEGLMAAGHRFLAEGSPADAALQGEIKPIVVAAEQRRLDELSLKAAGDEGGGLVELEKFAARYEGTDLGERALLNTFVAARAAGDSDALYRLGDELGQKYAKSEQLPGVLSTLARTAAARYEYDKSIEFFRKAADANPQDKVQLMTAAGALKEELADLRAAEAYYEEALKAADGPAREGPASALAILLEKKGDAKEIVDRLSKLGADAGPEVLARLGLAQLALGKVDEAEGSLAGVLDATSGASGEAIARAHYGMAEVLNAALVSYEPAGDVMGIQEFIALVEVTEQSYLNAARQGSPVYTAVALSRYAHMARTTSERFSRMTIPEGLSAEDVAQVKGAFESRSKEMSAQADQAVAACAEQAWAGHVFNVAIRWCLSGDLPKTPTVPSEPLVERTAPQIPGLEELRLTLSRNPEDLDALRELGTRLLDGGDPHAARLVFAKAAASGGGPLETNLLGIASWMTGDRTGALEAFAQAAEGGLEAGRQNIAMGLRKLGLADAATKALEKYPEGDGGGRLLPGAGGGGAL
ncbi:MAG: tetratricopeptide repeat protein [Deltaproteobacteria bacterium]|nr:tetratricopeptide repeat protein [Deltaproteobacteria bacterium]